VSVLDDGVAEQLTRTFEHDALVCERVTLEAWRRRNIGQKAIEMLASFVQDQV
jgi:hypothetical protein